MTNVKSKKNPKFVTTSDNGESNGYLVPIYNVHEHFYPDGSEPKQVYLTAISPNAIKGPHLHFVRSGCFTCIKGNVRVVMKFGLNYEVVKSGEDYDFISVMIPAGVPAAIQNLDSNEALVLNMPYPAWTPEMNDEHTADFSDFNFGEI